MLGVGVNNAPTYAMAGALLPSPSIGLDWQSIMQRQLLHILQDGDFHSGEGLGRRLGVSRTAVWKQLQKMPELGIDVESVRGRGHRIPGGLELLDEQRVLEQLQPEAARALSGIEILDSVDSTNRHLLERIAQQPSHGHVCSAEFQSLGRGRRGRPWLTPFAASVSMSLAWEFHAGVAALEGLSLAVGTAVAEALEAQDVEGATLKWPNDVLHEGRKLAGILLEMTGDPAGHCHVVVGVGVNVAMPAGASARIDQPWVDARSIAGHPVSRNRLLADLLNQLVPLMQRFERDGFGPFRSRWLELDAYGGQQVILTHGDQVVVGTGRGVDLSGALLVDTPAGLRRFHAGEVRIRRPE